MPRTHLQGASTLRNRNRITNKTRLRIIKGNVDAEDLLIPDEDEEKHRLTNLVAGVDAEDANEHHLQEVLSAAHRTQVAKKTEEKPQAYIPTPEANGVAENVDELYPPNRWRDPATYICTSTGVEESVANGIGGGFTYYMDERDKEWLDKNNEEARGEGTSAQGAVSASGTRTSARSSKAKGKEPDVAQPTALTEDEFELVMGLFEKITHDKTEFLHHSLETGMPFPAFSDYQDVFSAPLTPAMFAAYSIPSWIPQPQQLLRLARTIYPYWRERRIERAGHRIIPSLNGDESDTLNESYICFRRREIKAVRKTRQAQTTYSDKLVRLQAEFTYPLELAKLVLQRETQKKDTSAAAQKVWQDRMALADLKRKFPTFSEKGDEELLVDKEKPKKTEVVRLPPRPPRPPETVLSPLQTVVIKPRERIAQVKAATEAILAKQKEADRSWEDVIDNPYQQQPVPYASRLFQFIPPSDPASPSSSNSEKTADSDDEHASKMARVSRAVRLRYGRGGRLLMDRRDAISRKPVSNAARSSLFGSGDDDMQVDEQDPEEQERLKRLEEKWRFDSDDVPPSGPSGSDEQDRVLIDDYDPKYLRYSMSLLSEADHMALTVDPILHLPTTDGRQTAVLPYRLGMQQMVRRDAQGNLRYHNLQPMLPPSHALALQASMAGAVAGTPVAMQHQIKKMPPPTAVPQMRISSNGGMRPPTTPVVATASQPQPPSQSAPTPPTPTQVPAAQPVNGVSPATRPAIAMPHVELVKPAEPLVNGASVQSSTEAPQVQDVMMNGVAPPRPKSQNQAPVALSVPANGYHLTPMTATNPAAAFAQAHLQAGQRIPMTAQKIEQLKTAFGNMTPQEMAVLANSRALAAGNYVNSNGAMHIPATNVNLKLPPARQMQWAAMSGVGVQRPPSVVNGDAQTLQVNGVVAPTPAHIIPVRSPSANGVRAGMRIGSNGQLQMSPHLQHANTPSPMPNISQSQSPPRPSMTPTMTMATPPQQQTVGGTQNGY